MKKYILLILIVLIVFSGLIFYLNFKNKQTEIIDTTQEKIIGGDKDKGGCLIGAGYTWCEKKQRCLREWEESCEGIKQPITSQELLRNVDTPTDWKMEIESDKPVGCIAKYLNSPDYLMSEGYPLLEKGAQITVKICKTENTSIKDVFSSNSVKKSIAQNINELSFGNIPEIQYDYSFEGTIASDTIFIYKNYDYLVRLRYPSVNDKQTYWDTYSGILTKLQSNLLGEPTSE